MINLKNYNEVFKYFENTIKHLIIKYNLYDFENHIFEKLWILSEKIDISSFKDSKGLDNFIFISLKNFCLTLCSKNNYYKDHNIFCIDDDDFYHNSLILTDFNYSNIIFNDLISRLNTREKEIITYKFKNNYSDIEIGNILGISRQAVNKSLNKSLNKLKKEVICYE
ncbi:sigma-70 family RNA polymerase sigma factor [Clostridium sp.]|uniref:sigma-70 family RNA polymerase sigma factor n=1 Tax=Clostridium sp. TaxID=1506 RepID=UPI003996959C